MYIKDALVELAKLATIGHYTCEDSWYSCHKSIDESNECNCGADEHNEKVDAIINSISYEKS